MERGSKKFDQRPMFESQIEVGLNPCFPAYRHADLDLCSCSSKMDLDVPGEEILHL